jgi:hypothetical protein
MTEINLLPAPTGRKALHTPRPFWGPRTTVIATAVPYLSKCGGCGGTDHIVRHQGVQRVHNDRKGTRALKTAGYIAASMLLVGWRKKQWVDMDMDQLQCLECGAVFMPFMTSEQWLEAPTEADRNDWNTTTD